MRSVAVERTHIVPPGQRWQHAHRDEKATYGEMTRTHLVHMSEGQTGIMWLPCPRPLKDYGREPPHAFAQRGAGTGYQLPTAASPRTHVCGLLVGLVAMHHVSLAAAVLPILRRPLLGCARDPICKKSWYLPLDLSSARRAAGENQALVFSLCTWIVHTSEI